MSRSHDRPARPKYTSIQLPPSVAARLVTLNGLADTGGWPGIFGRSAPLELEIGFGWDTFLLEQAAARADTDFVGIEYDRQRVLSLARKAAGRGATNIRLVWGDAMYCLPRMFAPGSLRRVYIRFPDPWPKKRHHKHRLLGPEFLRGLFWHVAEDGELVAGTDDAEYRDFIRESLAAVAGLKNLAAPSPWLDTISGLPESKFEQLFREQGKSVYFFRYGRTRKFQAVHAAAIDAELARIPRRIDQMPHVVFNVPLDLAGLSREFEPFQWRDGEALFKVNEIWLSSREAAALLECIIVFDGHDEWFFVELANKHGGAVMRVSSAKDVERTELLFRCLAGLVRRLSARSPNLTIARHNLGAFAPPAG
jgi:tRNA (guanine-N7-)-methyltransferase